MIAANKLVKWFGAKLAVDAVSFTVAKGEVLGFLGPNGAGKSTTMRMLTGYLPPTSGSISIGGHNLEEDGLAARALVGYLPENAPVYPEMSVTGFLRFAAEARGLWGKARNLAVERVIETCFLEPIRRQTIETLSKGYRHRTCLAQCLLHDPPVLVMDEPTDGLDPNQKHEVRNLIRRMGADKAIILSTHILEEVDAVCSRAIVIDRGRLVANGTPAELRARSASAGQVRVRLQGPAAKEAAAALRALDGAAAAVVDAESAAGITLIVSPDPRDGRHPNLGPAVAALVAARHWTCDELRVEEGRLDEFFRAVTVPDTKREEKG